MPKTQKVSIEEKIRLVRLCMSGEMGVKEAGREAGVNHKTVSRWMVRYEADGLDGFLPQEKNRVYSPELKKKAVEEYLSGQGSLLEVSRRHKISNPCLVEAWIKVYNAHGDFNSVKHSGGGSYMKQGRKTTKTNPRLSQKLC